MNPEQKKNHQGGSRLQKTEKKPREKRPGRPRTRRQKVLRGLYIALTVIAAVIGAICMRVVFYELGASVFMLY